MTINFEPTPKQFYALNLLLNNNGINHILFGGSAGGGKSFIGCIWLILSSLKYPESRWIMGRTSLTALKSTTLVTFLNIIKEWGLTDSIKVNNQSNTITFSNGSVILMKDLEFKPSDPNFDSLGSIEVTGAFVDESAQLSEKAYEVLGSRIRYKLDQFNIEPKLLMTCNPSKGFLYTLFYKASINGNIASWRSFIQSKYSDNPHLSKEYVKALDRLSPFLRARLMDGDWDFNDEIGQLIYPESIFNLPTTITPDRGIMYLTLDIARFGRDKTVGYVWRDLTVIDCIIINKENLERQLILIKDVVKKYNILNSNIIVDSDGVGGGISDMLKARPIVNGSRALKDENFVNLKTQLFYKLSEVINQVKIVHGVWNKNIDKSTLGDQLSQELNYIRRVDVDSDGKLQIMRKDKIKTLIGRSPDFMDALAYRMLPIVSPKFKVSTYKKI